MLFITLCLIIFLFLHRISHVALNSWSQNNITIILRVLFTQAVIRSFCHEIITDKLLLLPNSQVETLINDKTCLVHTCVLAGKRFFSLKDSVESSASLRRHYRAPHKKIRRYGHRLRFIFAKNFSHKLIDFSIQQNIVGFGLLYRRHSQSEPIRFEILDL